MILCPNDNTPMQEVTRNGVLLDICPECRGVWLDRGELEKLLGLVGRGPKPDAGVRRPPQEEYRERQHDKSKRRNRFELFDFFD